jgi:hypothetical protein
MNGDPDCSVTREQWPEVLRMFPDAGLAFGPEFPRLLPIGSVSLDELFPSPSDPAAVQKALDASGIRCVFSKPTAPAAAKRQFLFHYANNSNVLGLVAWRPEDGPFADLRQAIDRRGFTNAVPVTALINARKRPPADIDF